MWIQDDKVEKMRIKHTTENNHELQIIINIYNIHKYRVLSTT